MEQTRRRFLVSGVTVASSIALAGCSEDEETDTVEANVDEGGSDGSDGSNDGSSGIEILDHELYRTGPGGVEGTVRNNTDEDSYVEVDVVFLDEDGTQIGEGYDSVSDLAADREWEFDCIFINDNPRRIDSYEIEASTGL